MKIRTEPATITIDDVRSWDLVIELQQVCKNLFDKNDLMKNHYEIDVVLRVAWKYLTLMYEDLTLPKREKIYTEFEEWMLGEKYQGLYEFKNYLEEV